MAKRCYLFIGSFSIVLAATTAAAQQSGAAVTETVATVRDRDINGTERVSERVVTRTTRDKDREEVVIETYRPSIYADRVALSERVRRITTVTSDGSRTVEETEESPRGSPHEPMRVVRRSVTTVRRTGSNSSEIEEQVFHPDGDGRLAPVPTQIERTLRR